MKMVLKLKLITDKESDRLLRETTEQYMLACNHISQVAFLTRVFDRDDLHRLVYYETKGLFCLPSQLVIRAMAEVRSAYKSLMTQITNHNRTCKPEERRELTRIEFGHNLALPYDSRILMVDTEGLRVSLRTLHVRVWFNFKVGEDRKPLLKYVKGQADLKRYGKKWYLHQTIEVPDGTPIHPTNHVGVDVGICTVASSTDGKDTLRFEGARIRFLGAESTRHERTDCMQEHLHTDRRKPLRLRSGS